MKTNKLAAGIFLALALASPASQAAVKGEVNYTYSAKQQPLREYLKGKFSYDVPFGIKGSSFCDWKNGRYFGKTNLTSPRAEGICAKVQLVHNNEPLSEAGMGLDIALPLPKQLSFNLNMLPVWLNKDGLNSNKWTVGYSLKIQLPYGFEVRSCGDWNLADKSQETQWLYGENDLEKRITDRVVASYNTAMTSKGGAVPEFIHRVVVGVRF